MSEAAPKSNWKYLGRKPGSVYKQLYVSGRNIAARTLYGRYMSDEDPETPEEIATNYDLPLDVVLEAIAYCEADPPEIQEDWDMDEASVRRRFGTHPEHVTVENASAPEGTVAHP
jgi:uncharacterized protein (DUF433 family)